MSKNFTNSKLRFRIRLKQAHEESGLSAYMVSKETGISAATVRKYTDVDEIIGETLPSPVITLAKFYGVDWRNPEIIQVITEESDDTPGQSKTPLRESDKIPA